jgi:hypothetical protein
MLSKCKLQRNRSQSLRIKQSEELVLQRFLRKLGGEVHKNLRKTEKREPRSSASWQALAQKKARHEFETPSLPTLGRRYPRDFAFYLVDPIGSFHELSRIFGARLGGILFVRIRGIGV